MDSFGAYLKAHREKKGIRLEEIASITKIHLHALELLEANRWDQLPPEPFIRGFIIAYAKYVGLGTSEVLDKFREATGEATVPVSPSTETPKMGGIPQPVVSSPNEIITRVRLPSGPKMITAASLIAVVGLAALLINVGKDADQTTVAQTPTQVTVTPEAPPQQQVADDRKVAETKTATAAPAATASAASPAPAIEGPAAHEVTVEGKERTWIKVVIDESAPTEYFLQEGKAVTYKAAHKIKVVLGNSTGSKVTYNGKEAEGKQFMGTIKSYKFPPDAHFPQDVPSKKPEGAGSE